MRTEVKHGRMMENSLLKALAESTAKAKVLLEDYKSVTDNVEKYLKENNLGELVDIVKASEHPDDHYLYMVIARVPNKHNFHNGEWSYRCWTCWNETTQSLNYGHYNLESYKEAVRICHEHIHRIY